MPLYLVTTPTVDVLSRADVKKHLHVEAANTDDDDLIDALIDAVTSHMDGRDGILNRALIAQTWDLKLDEFPYPGCRNAWRWSSYHYSIDPRDDYCIWIPLPPLISVTSIKYIDANGVEQTFDPASYHVVGANGGQPGRIQCRKGVSWPVFMRVWPEPVTVRFVAGYVDTSNSPAIGEVPPAIIAAMKLTLGHLYANRESVVVGAHAQTVEIPQSAQYLLEPFKVFA